MISIDWDLVMKDLSIALHISKITLMHMPPNQLVALMPCFSLRCIGIGTKCPTSKEVGVDGWRTTNKKIDSQPGRSPRTSGAYHEGDLQIDHARSWGRLRWQGATASQIFDTWRSASHLHPMGPWWPCLPLVSSSLVDFFWGSLWHFFWPFYCFSVSVG